MKEAPSIRRGFFRLIQETLGLETLRQLEYFLFSSLFQKGIRFYGCEMELAISKQNVLLDRPSSG